MVQLHPPPARTQDVHLLGVGAFPDPWTRRGSFGVGCTPASVLACCARTAADAAATLPDAIVVAE